MKKLLFLVLFVTSLSYSQTVVELTKLTENLVLGENCDNSQGPLEFFVNDTLDLNGFNIDLRNADLIVNGDLTGNGSVTNCGNSLLYVTGKIIGVTLYGIASTDETLSNTYYNVSKDFKYIYNEKSKKLIVPDARFIKIYDKSGKKLLQVKGGYTDLTFIGTKDLIVKTNKKEFNLKIK